MLRKKPRRLSCNEHWLETGLDPAWRMEPQEKDVACRIWGMLEASRIHWRFIYLIWRWDMYDTPVRPFGMKAVHQRQTAVRKQTVKNRAQCDRCHLESLVDGLWIYCKSIDSIARPKQQVPQAQRNPSGHSMQRRPSDRHRRRISPPGA